LSVILTLNIHLIILISARSAAQLSTQLN